MRTIISLFTAILISSISFSKCIVSYNCGSGATCYAILSGKCEDYEFSSNVTNCENQGIAPSGSVIIQTYLCGAIEKSIVYTEDDEIRLQYVDASSSQVDILIADLSSYTFDNATNAVHFETLTSPSCDDNSITYSVSQGDISSVILDQSPNKNGDNNQIKVVPSLPEIFVTPNPAHDFISINISGFTVQDEITFTLQDLQGRVVKSSILNSATVARINVSDISSGNYLVTFTNKDATFKQSQKLIISNN